MSTWKLVCVGATVAATNSDFQQWDTGSSASGSGSRGSSTGYLPDPTCQLEVDGEGVVASTSILADTLNPRWNESITPTTRPTAAQLMSQDTAWSISVVDDDGRDGTELVCSVSPQLTATDFVSTDLTFINVQSCTTLNIHLACVP
jgi:C2 domain